LNKDKKAFSLLSKTSKGKPCYVVHEDSDPHNDRSEDPMFLVRCLPKDDSLSFADNAAWYLSVPIFKSAGTYSIEAANAPDSFLRRAFEYAKLSQYKFISNMEYK
jgi:hypothetical protein